MSSASAQPPGVADGEFSRQVQLVVDNDAYFFTSYDRYYSSGIFASYSQLQEALPFAGKKEGTAGLHKYSIDLRFSHYIYTPKNILWYQENKLDRPYAGMATMGVKLNYLHEKSGFTLQANLGWLGPAIKTKEIHRLWHKILGIRLPRGWDYQINNSPAVIVMPEYLQRWPLSAKSDVVSTSGLMAGTVFNRLYQGFAFRFGKPRALHQSHLTNGLLGLERKKQGLYEWYVLAGLQLARVFYDATIDGNFIGPESPYTENSESWVLRQTYGVVLAGARTDFELSFKVTSHETEEAEYHRYMRAKISYRF